uniref:BTB domain-containing protein n=1 Tax=Oryza glumipatula TaxID=40148 RepID=A0A0D9YR21_9ORYZ
MANDCNTISSAIVAETVSGSHVMKIDGYSKTKALINNEECMSSTPFSVAGYTWTIRYYPNGQSTECREYLSLYLFLDSFARDVKAIYSFKLLDKNGRPLLLNSITSPVRTFKLRGTGLGYPMFIKSKDLKASESLRDDSFSIRCDVTVMKPICSKETPAMPKPSVEVPLGDLHQHLGDLLKNMDGADVTFDVGQERFSAHKCMLAARSSVFKAMFFGATRAKPCRSNIKIEDMEAGVFRSFLHFVYTDLLPDTLQGVVMAQQLLVAADRYNVERLKLICEEKLSEHIDSNMVATNLALAEQHRCHQLKEACFKFLIDSPSNIESMVESDGYEHLKTSCPYVLNELAARLLPHEMKAAKQITMALSVPP